MVGDRRLRAGFGEPAVDASEGIGRWDEGEAAAVDAAVAGLAIDADRGRDGNLGEAVGADVGGFDAEEAFGAEDDDAPLAG